MNRLIAYGAYVPYNRLQRAAIGAALGAGGGKGTRAVASYDEDATSMGVEASRIALRQAGDVSPRTLWFATAMPPYLDKTNATAIHAALGLDDDCIAADATGSVRSGAAAIWAALDSAQPTLVVLSDLRTGLPGGADERDGGDAAAALLFGGDDTTSPAAEVIGRAAVTDEFLERWRLPGEPASHTWEDRFGEHVYVPLGRQALDAALKDAGISIGDVDHLIVTGLHGRAVKAVAAKAGAKAVADDLGATVGNTGTAHVGLSLADVLDRAQPGETIAVLVLADGAVAFVVRVDAGINQRRPQITVQEQVAGGRDDLVYQAFLSWRGFLTREPPRRPDPVPGAPPPSYRNEGWKFGFTGSTCEACGTRHLPPARVCVRCGAVDQMRPERLADVQATVATFTVDRLAYTPSPPLVAAVLDFDGGGRFSLELTDVDPKSVAIGNRVEMTFRRLVTAAGVHNYFWKARPVRGNAGSPSE